MVADEQHHLHPFAELLVAAIEIAAVMRRVEHAGDPVRPLDLVAVHAGVEHTRVGVADHQAADRDVLAGVALGVVDDGQLGEIDVGAFPDDLLDRRGAWVTASRLKSPSLTRPS